MNVEILESSFAALADRAEELVSSFYEELFNRFPDVKPLFKDSQIEEQKKKLLAALVLVVNNLRNPGVLEEAIRDLGRRHKNYGALPEHYPAVAETLLDVMQEMAGELWTDEVDDAWSEALNKIAEIMLSEYESTEANEMGTENNVEINELKKELEELKSIHSDYEGQVSAISKAQAVIEFNMDGTIITANDNFLGAVDYSLEEIQGKHHSMFAEPAYAQSVEYKQFWEKLNRGEFDSGEYKRVGKAGKEIWIQASYNPIFDTNGNAFKVVKYATDVSAQKLEAADYAGQLDAISKVQAVIEFNMDGTIISANDNFLTTLGYSLDEIQGKHHGMFVEASYRDSSEYKQFWESLNKGEYQEGQYRRLAKGDREIWIQASYNPIFDMNGNPFKVVKFATDGTELRQRREEQTRLQAAVDGCQSPMIMIDRDFIITYANEETIALLKKYESKFREVWPSFSADAVMGVCIDMFHKNPTHQRTMLADPKNLPYQTDIEIADLKFSLTVSAQMDPEGEYIGNTLEWQDVTELRVKENEQTRLQVAVDGCQSPMIMIDRDFIITYVNDATVDLLKKYESKFREVWPGFSVAGAMGSCIDMFHKNPEHQRNMLADPNNLPYQTDIEINGLKFALTVSAQRDAQGNYIGNTLEWEDVTEQRTKDLEVARLQSAVNGAQANIMLCDQDLNITYVNPAVVDMLALRQAELRQIWPGFDANNLVGECIDQFHKNPSHQRQLLADVSRLPAKAEIKMGDIEFEVNATAVLDFDGNYMGNMVEWRDITEQKDAERQIQNLIDAAAVGQLDERINADNYQGFMRGLGEGINRMMETVVKPIRETKRVVEALATGDLTEKASGDYQGEFSLLLEAVNTSMSNLLNMVNEIRGTSNTINTSASEISQGNADLSQRTEEQASSLEETASSIEELTGTVKQNADNARQANQLADSAREQAEKGGEVVGNAVSAMGEINQSSKKISDIIGVIDEIAFQTNLLALNAAVEAARAGEQGRGFAVVASEVRNLAQRSAEAAKEIKTLINDSVQKVEEGSRLVDESGTTLEEIVNSVKKVNDIIAEIAAASEEQSAGIEQVNKAITQMDQMTQQNAALVEEAAAASESMDEQSKGLNKLMEYFEVGDEGSAAVERRSEERPWTKPAETAPKPASASSAPAKPKKRAAAGAAVEDSEWEEF